MEKAGWSSRIAFLMAAIGAAVGLGNIWKFPYMAGTQGGGAFVIIYLVSIFAIAIPICAAELAIGRQGGSDAVGSIGALCSKFKKSAHWGIVGLLGVIGCFLILSFYAVIAGWVIAYVPISFSGGFSALDAEGVGAVFSSLLASPAKLILWQIAFLILTFLIVSRQLHQGIERASIILLPTLLFMLLALAVYSGFVGDMGKALAFMFTPDFSKITPSVVLSAVGHGFFSVGVGLAMMITYGAYLTQYGGVGRFSAIIGIVDTCIALIAGIGIFAIVFAQNLDPSAGPGLLFTTLPLAFNGLPLGSFVGGLFFLLVVFAALTSAIALLEVVVRWCVESFSMPRRKASAYVCLAAGIIGLASVFSFNIWSGFHPFSEGKTIFDVKDYFTSTILMPTCAFLTVIFAVWVLPKEALHPSFATSEKEWVFKTWYFFCRFVAPAGLIWMFLRSFF